MAHVKLEHKIQRSAMWRTPNNPRDVHGRTLFLMGHLDDRLVFLFNCIDLVQRMRLDHEKIYRELRFPHSFVYIWLNYVWLLYDDKSSFSSDSKKHRKQRMTSIKIYLNRILMGWSLRGIKKIWHLCWKFKKYIYWTSARLQEQHFLRNLITIL